MLMIVTLPLPNQGLEVEVWLPSSESSLRSSEELPALERLGKAVEDCGAGPLLEYEESQARD